MSDINFARLFKDEIEHIIQINLQDLDNTYMAIVKSVHDDGSIDVCLPEDPTNIITRVMNTSKYNLTIGDSVMLYARRNRLSDSFVINKNGGTIKDVPKNTNETVVNNYYSEEVQSSSLGEIAIKNGILFLP